MRAKFPTRIRASGRNLQKNAIKKHHRLGWRARYSRWGAGSVVEVGIVTGLAAFSRAAGLVVIVVSRSPVSVIGAEIVAVRVVLLVEVLLRIRLHVVPAIAVLGSRDFDEIGGVLRFQREDKNGLFLCVRYTGDAAF